MFQKFFVAVEDHAQKCLYQPPKGYTNHFNPSLFVRFYCWMAHILSNNQIATKKSRIQETLNLSNDA